MTKPHILVVNVFYAPFSYGGATIVAEQVAQSLLQSGACSVTAVSTCSRSDLQAYSVACTEKDGIVNYLINLPPDRKFTEIYNNPQVTEILAQLIDAIAPNVIHMHCLQDIGAGGLSVAREANIPVVLSIHDFWWVCERQFMIRPDSRYCNQNPIDIDTCQHCVANRGATKLRSDYLRRQADLADLITYPSEFARGLCESSGFAPGGGVVWENGVRPPSPAFFAKQKARRARSSAIVFGFLGGPSQIKGWPLVRQAFSDIGRDDFAGILVDGSTDGSWWQSADLTTLRGTWQIQPRFEQSAVDDFYAQIDVLLFMSQWKETFGLAIREAVARGITVIQTDSGGTTEHSGVDREHLLPIGAPATALTKRLNDVLDAPPFTRLLPVRTYDEQASEFLSMVAPLLAK